MGHRRDLLAIIIITSAFSVLAITLFCLNFGFSRFPQQILRLLLIAALSYFLYQERRWAKWVYVLLTFLAGLGGILGAYFSFAETAFSFLTFSMLLVSVFFLTVSIYLGFIRKWRAG